LSSGAFIAHATFRADGSFFYGTSNGARGRGNVTLLESNAVQVQFSSSFGPSSDYQDDDLIFNRADPIYNTFVDFCGFCGPEFGQSRKGGALTMIEGQIADIMRQFPFLTDPSFYAHLQQNIDNLMAQGLLDCSAGPGQCTYRQSTGLPDPVNPLNNAGNTDTRTVTPALSGSAGLQDRADQLAAEISKRGYFTGKGEADWLYQINSDPNLAVTVDAARLTATANGDWVADPNGGFRVPGYITGSDYAVHGQVTLRFRPNGSYGVFDQRYDYELHADFSPRGVARNFGTIVGRPPGGFPNTPYWIRYQGNVNVTNPYNGDWP
jgi:hypothetical protein